MSGLNHNQIICLKTDLINLVKDIHECQDIIRGLNPYLENKLSALSNKSYRIYSSLDNYPQILVDSGG